MGPGPFLKAGDTVKLWIENIAAGAYDRLIQTPFQPDTKERAW